MKLKILAHLTGTIGEVSALLQQDRRGEATCGEHNHIRLDPHLVAGNACERCHDTPFDTVKQLEAYSSGIGDRIQQAELLTPVDLAEEFSLPGGHLSHLEQALDQFALMRPVPWASRYSTPIKGLYLAGSGSHPGGGITGLPGFLGANAALREVSG